MFVFFTTDLLYLANDSRHVGCVLEAKVSLNPLRLLRSYQSFFFVFFFAKIISSLKKKKKIAICHFEIGVKQIGVKQIGVKQIWGVLAHTLPNVYTYPKFYVISMAR